MKYYYLTFFFFFEILLRIYLSQTDTIGQEARSQILLVIFFLFYFYLRWKIFQPVYMGKGVETFINLLEHLFLVSQKKKNVS